MIPAVDVKEEEVNKLSCSPVHVGGWSVSLDGENYMHVHYIHMGCAHGYMSTSTRLGIHSLLWLEDIHGTIFSCRQFLKVIHLLNFLSHHLFALSLCNKYDWFINS